MLGPSTNRPVVDMFYNLLLSHLHNFTCEHRTLHERNNLFCASFYLSFYVAVECCRLGCWFVSFSHCAQIANCCCTRHILILLLFRFRYKFLLAINRRIFVSLLLFFGLLDWNQNVCAARFSGCCVLCERTQVLNACF